MSRARLGFVIILFLGLLAFTLGGMDPASAAGGLRLAPHVPGEILIKFEAGARGLDKASAQAQLNAAKVKTFRSGAEHWRLGPGVSVEQALERMKKNPHVKYAEPNYVITADLVPNDPRLNELYGMINTGQTGGTADADIDADQAWSIARGSHDVVVGIIDTGVDYNHPDLSANIWTNPGEIAGNHIDDDGNGFIDDVHGYDFVNNDGDPFDDNGHGTHCAGTIGGVGNNGIGVVGVNWDVSILACKFLSGAGSGSTDGAIACVEYTTMMGVTLTSNSWGGGGFSQALSDSIAEAGANEIAFIAAAGNNGTNNDTSPHYPSSYTLPSIISVAATDHNDAVASFSNYGALSVDIAAPGVNILSAQPGGGYQLLSGTSMATPHVAGAAALLKSRFPNLPVAQLKFALMSFADQKAQLNPVTGTRPVASGGRLNVFFSIADPDETAPGAVSDLAVASTGSNHALLNWTAVGDDGLVGTATSYQMRHSTSPITEENFSSATRAGNEPNPGAAGSAQAMEVRGLAANTLYYFAVKAFDEWGNAGPISNVAYGTTLPPPTVGWTPTSITEELLTGEVAHHTVTLRNDGVGTLDFNIPQPALSEPMAAPVEPLFLGKDEPDPRVGDPVIQGAGGPDAFGYRWTDSNQAGGPVFSWQDISGTGSLIGDVTTDDDTSAAIPLGFTFPFYGNSFGSIRVCSNGWLSFTNGTTAYQNQSLPSTGAPENLIAPLWDDLNPGGVARIYFQSFGNRAIVQWQGMPRYQTGAPGDQEPGSALTFQAILDANGAVTYQYLNLAGTLNSATVGLQNATGTIGLTTAFNASYLTNNLAVRYSAMPQWLRVSPNSGRLPAGASIPLDVTIDAAGLEGGTFPGQISIVNNDPVTPVATVNVSLHVIGAPDASVSPLSLAYGDRFAGLAHDLSVQVANVGTDTLHVGVAVGDPSVVATPASFNVPPHGSQTVNVRWTPAGLGPLSTTLTVNSDDAGQPSIPVSITGNGIPAPVAVPSPTSLTQTLLTGGTATQVITMSNSGGSNLIVSAAADQGNGAGLIPGGPQTEGNGGPDAFGYRWRDSDAPGGPAFNFIDISATGTPISFGTLDDAISGAINMGMSFPLYGTSFNQLKVCTNGWITFDTTTTTTTFSNAALPNTTLARSAIALFWDDLHLRTGNVRYQNDGTRFIVQYTGIGRISPTTGVNLTFQVQLYPNGRILVMYQTMSGTTLNSGTVGIQNQARTVALQMVSQTGTGTPYVHNNLALQISRLPDWLTVSPGGPITIPPGGSAPFNVGFDATDRSGGVLNGNIVFTTNIPGQTTVTVPATLTIVDAPHAAVFPASVNFGTVFAGFPQLTNFQILNTGTVNLNVSDVVSSDPSLTIEAEPGPTASFAVPPGGSHLMTMRWSPAGPGPLNATVTVISDDPSPTPARLTVTGNAIVAPVAGWAPAEFNEAANAGAILNRPMLLTNTGGSNLSYSVALRADGGMPVPIYDELKLGKEEPDPRPGILGTGGPDLFGYRWKDSDEPGGPTFDWTDISATGTPLSTLDADDEAELNIPIGFSFPFYGSAFTTVNVNTNGWLSFTSTLASGSSAYTNQPLPNSGTAPENLLAPFWDDLHFRSAVRAHYLNDGSRFILQYTNVDRITAGSSLTFQVILYPNGRIVYQYLTMNSPTLDSATIGVQNATRNDGLTVVHNAAYMHNNLAIEIRPPLDFLQVTPTSGTIPPGGSQTFDVRFDLTHVIGGDYAASIDLITNDPAAGLISIPVRLHVTGIPGVQVTPASLAFPTTFVGFGSPLPASVRSVGTDVLHVSSISTTGPFTVSNAGPANLAVGTALPLTVTFVPPAAGAFSGTLTIQSDDPDEASVEVPLSGNALIPPEIDVDPDAISTALPPGGVRTKSLTLSNNGGSDLSWTTGTNIVSAIQPGTYVALGKDEVDDRVGILGNGGPDLFGYRWRDSDDPGGPTFAWTDISSTGTPIAGLDSDDEISLNIPLGLSFPYYGNTFTKVNVHTNGYLSFTNTVNSGIGTYTNQPLPNSSTSVAENLLAVFWDDLDFRSAVHAYYLNDGSRFIVQWNNVDRHPAEAPDPDHLTFQAILYPSGRIVFQYRTMNGKLDSATVGQQNASRDDGLTVVFNAAYMHDDLAIEIAPIPEWVTVNPTGGVIPAGGSTALTVLLNAAGLDDGLHESTIDVSSNDPYTPMVHVPVTLNVGLLPTAYLNFDPDVLNLSSNGTMVKMVIELPAGYDPHAVDVASVLLNDTVHALSSPVGFSDENGNGVEEIVVRFDRSEVEAVLPAGTSVPVTVQLEVADVQWFRGTTTARVMRPQVHGPNGGEYLVAGQTVPITWDAAAASGNIRYNVYLTRDGGGTWELLAQNVNGTAWSWAVGGTPTNQARVRVVALDNQGVMGYDASDASFVVASQMNPPADVGETLELSLNGSDVVLTWKRPVADAMFGPVDHYRVLRSLRANGPFNEAAITTNEMFREPLAGAPGEIVYYKVIAANAAGDASN